MVDTPTLAALERVRASGRKLILVTGRVLDDLLQVFPQVPLFDLVVAENGALLYQPATREEHVLGERPPAALLTTLQQRGIAP
jgi:hydroxymethylpyrimidine pyrophosphatase-like HAD family hydrolase